jgi:NTP pyrophosphatase (non-canonical NTP hydrolase)
MPAQQPTTSLIPDLQQRLRQFAAERDWEQFHTPKNLAMALTVEAGELQEIRWLTPEQSHQLDASQRQHTAEELADVLLYLCRLSDVLGIDLAQAAYAKLARNAEKYPAAQARGSSAKYDKYS